MLLSNSAFIVPILIRRHDCSFMYTLYVHIQTSFCDTSAASWKLYWVFFSLDFCYFCSYVVLFYSGCLFNPFLLPFSQRVVVYRILPALTSEFVNPDMVPFVLPNVLLIAEECTKEEYIRLILPDLTPVFKQQEPIQVDTHKNTRHAIVF